MAISFGGYIYAKKEYPYVVPLQAGTNKVDPLPKQKADVEVAVLKANSGAAKRLVARIARDFPRRHPPCPVGTDRALDHAIMTAPGSRDPALLAKLDAVAGRVLKPAAG